MLDLKFTVGCFVLSTVLVLTSGLSGYSRGLTNNPFPAGSTVREETAMGWSLRQLRRSSAKYIHSTMCTISKPFALHVL